MTDFLVNFAHIVDVADKAIYAYEPEADDTINNADELSAYAIRLGQNKAVDGMLWAAYAVMLNPSAKAAVARGNINVEDYFYYAFKDSYDQGVRAVSAALGINEDTYYEDVGGRALDDMDAAEQALTIATANRRNFRAGQDGYKEAVAQLDMAKKNMEKTILMYPSSRVIVESILSYFFHFLAGFGDGTNWKTHQAIQDGLFDALPELSQLVKLKDWWRLGAAKNYHPAMIAEMYFRGAVSRSDIDKLNFRKDQLIKWMSTARKENGRKHDIYIARQGIPDNIWDGYKEQVIEKYNKGVDLITKGITTWDEEDYDAAMEEEQEETRKDNDFLSDDEYDDLTDEQINKMLRDTEQFYTDVAEKELLGGRSKEEAEKQLEREIRGRKKKRKANGPRGAEGSNPFIDDSAKDPDDSSSNDEGEEPSSDDEEDDTGDLTEEQIEMYNMAFGTDDDGMGADYTLT